MTIQKVIIHETDRGKYCVRWQRWEGTYLTEGHTLHRDLDAAIERAATLLRGDYDSTLGDVTIDEGDTNVDVDA